MKITSTMAQLQPKREGYTGHDGSVSATRVALNYLDQHGDGVVKRTKAALIAGVGSPLAAAQEGAGMGVAGVVFGVMFPLVLPTAIMMAPALTVYGALRGAMTGMLAGAKDAVGILKDGASYDHPSSFGGPPPPDAR